MSNLSVEGKLKRIHDEQVISDRFKKREFVIETEEQYPLWVLFFGFNYKFSLFKAVANDLFVVNAL